MNRIRTFLIGSAIAALTMVGAPYAAQAAESAPAAPDGATVQADGVTVQADGYLHTWRDVNFQNYCAGFLRTSTDWGGCRNQVSSLWNNGFPGSLDDVLVFWDTNHRGASRGVHNGDSLSNLLDWTFDQNGFGGGERLNDNIASHRWVNL